MGIWRVIGSTRLHNLAARSVRISNSKPSGNTLSHSSNSMAPCVPGIHHAKAHTIRKPPCTPPDLWAGTPLVQQE
eukprot:612817-Pelagomonas_calceolata.AAC.1